MICMRSVANRMRTLLLLTFAVFLLPWPAMGQGGTWETKAQMPTPRYDLAVGVVNGILYAVGGAIQPDPWTNRLATVEAYDPTTNAWTTKAPMPTPRWGLGVGVVNGILYAVGGYDGASYSAVEAYDPATDSWTAKAPMPVGLCWFGLAVMDGLIYAVGGGTTSSEAVTTVEVYDPATDSWTARAPMPTARGDVGAGEVNGILYAVGGQLDYRTYLATVEAYDPATDAWAAANPLPIAISRSSVGVVGGTLFALGGNNYEAMGKVEAFDPVTGNWTAQASMPTARGGHGVGFVNGILYVAGGWLGANTPVATLEAFTPGVSCDDQVQDLEAQVGALEEENGQLQADLDSANASIQDLENSVAVLAAQLGTVTAGLDSVEQRFQQAFHDPEFTIPGSTPLEQYQNLVNAILGLNRGRLQGLYAALGGR